jgi:hypothetical protein
MTVPNLTGNTALDVAIGLAFVYLLFSILCSAVQEAIAGIFDMRAATLEKALRNLLEDTGAAGVGGAPTAAPAAAPAAAAPPPPASPQPDLTDMVLGHGLIRTLYRNSKFLLRRKRRGPSYIPSQTFALALLNTIAPETAGGDPLAKVRTAISDFHPLPAGTRSALLSLANEAGADRDRFRALVEQWFDGTMERASGWYKRKTQIVICALALLVAVGLNVNTVSIADRLAHDDSVRAAVVQAASATTAKPGDDPATAASNISKLRELGLPLGWNKAKGDPARADLSEHFTRTVLGWLLTFLALSLGAPFWFDALSRLAGLRNSGAKPEKSTA